MGNPQLRVQFLNGCSHYYALTGAGWKYTTEGHGPARLVIYTKEDTKDGRLEFPLSNIALVEVIIPKQPVDMVNDFVDRHEKKLYTSLYTSLHEIFGT